MNIEYNDKYTFLAMLDKLIIAKLMKRVNPELKISPDEKFYTSIYMETMYFDDFLDNLKFFFEYAGVGSILVGIDEHEEILEGEITQDIDGAIFSFHLKDLVRLEQLNAPESKISAYTAEIFSCFNKHVDVEWFDVNGDEYTQFIGALFHYDYSWHRLIEVLIDIILKIRKDCELYENNSNNC